MANFIELELDTTGPKIMLTAPQYTIPQIETEIWVRASEQLGTYQEFHIIDTFGKRHDMLFEYLGDSFRGVYNFNDVPIGICLVYARVKDEVDNLSPLISAAINVRKPAPLELTVVKMVRPVVIDLDIRSVESALQLRKMTTSSVTRTTVCSQKVRAIEVRAN